MSKYLLLLVYPLILAFCFFLIYRKYKQAIVNNIKPLIINTIIISLIIMVGLIVFFHFEDTIYAYDYAGHWIRALNLRRLFFEDSSKILPIVYDSMNNSDYSYLPALFELPLMLLKEGYRWFALVNYVCFLLPTIILLQILYYRYLNGNRYLPIILSIVIYPLYLPIFYGKVDCCGLFFITMAYALIILQKFEDIDLIDNISINLFAFLAIFLRRWYLYSVICLYISYLVKWLFYKNKKTSDLLKLLSSGIFALVAILVFFMPFINNSLSNNFEEAYAFYNNDGKLYSLIDYISPIICLICIIGIIRLFKTNKELLLINLISIVIPCALIWSIQSFEFHHYYVFLLNIIILFIYGFNCISSYKLISYLTIALLLVQSAFIYSRIENTMPLFTNIRKNPEVLNDKQDLIDLSSYIKSIEPNEDTTAFLAGGTYGIITDDLLRNALLPDLDYPNIDSSVFDLRDGFPKDMQFIKYVITIDPMLYTDKEYQHMFDVIANSIKNDEKVSSIYNPIYTKVINEKYTITIYERSGEYTQEIKQHFYDEMLKYYPDKLEFFKYILD